VNADPISLVPGSAEWLREMTASKVAAVLGLSPWESPFSLWYRMKGALAPEVQNAAMERGHYLEDAVARWVQDQHVLTLRAGGCWRNRSRPWQVSSPDRLAITPRGTPYEVRGVVEVKTAADWEKWGPDGTDEVPPYYRAQAVWQCDTLEVDTAYMGVLLPRLELRSYVLHPAEGEAEFIRERVRDFLDSLAADVPPDVDGHSETYSTLRALHPGIDGTEVDLDPDLAQRYARAVLTLRAAEDEHTYARSLVAAAMGDAQKGMLDGRKVAGRQPGPKGSPYVKAGTDRVLLAVASDGAEEG
jgi:putative phage-type endonuclease